MSNELAVINEDKALALMPVMQLEQAVARRKAVIDFTSALMVEDTHYGKIPGTDKPTLYKAGAEMLSNFFGLSPRFVQEECVEDWSGGEHGDEPFFFYRYRCQLWRGDLLAGEGLGSCNSWERKYRFRNADLKCPNCGQEGTVIKGKEEYGGGWLCWNKKGGCQSKWPDGAPEIENQERGKVANDNPQDLVNTIDKMAQKRALVAATLIAVNASEFFTQDVEDMDFGAIEGEYKEVKKGNGSGSAGNGNERPAGNGAPPKQAPERDPMELALKRVKATAKEFFPALQEITEWKAEDLKGAAKTLGMSKVYGDDRRLNQFKTIVEYAGLIDDGIENGLAIAVVNGAITKEEAEAEMASKAANDEEE